jgi:LPXTG-motif cell wall-anchored protein
MKTNPPAGSDVSPGDTIEVTFTWNPDDWSGTSLHKAINCVTVNGAFVLDLSVEERPTDNDGEFTAIYTIPVDAADGSQVCNQGFVSGDTSGGGFGHERSDQCCFTVRAPASSAAAPTPAPEAPATPAPATPAPATPAPVPAVVLGEQLVAPAPATPAPAQAAPAAAVAAPEVAGDTLPRTGQDTRRGPLLLAGIGLTLGGLGLVGGNRRPRRAIAPGPV